MSKLNANATEWRPGSSGDGSGPEFTLPASTNEMDTTTTTTSGSNNHAYTSQSVSRVGTAANTPALTAMNNNLTHTPQLSMSNKNNNNNVTNMNCSDYSTDSESTAAASAMMTMMMMNQNNNNNNNNFNFANPMNLNSANMPNMMMPMGMMPPANVAMPSLMPNMMMMQPSPSSQQPSTFATPAMFMPQPFAMPMSTPMMGLTNSVNNNVSAAATSVMGGGNFIMPQPQGMTAMPMMPQMMMNANPTVMPEYYPTFMTINKSIKVDSENSSDANAESSKENTINNKQGKDQTATDATSKNKDSSSNNNGNNANVTFGEMNWKVEFNKVIKLTEELIEQQISGVAEEAAQKKVAQEIFNTPAVNIMNENNINTANESKNKSELGVLSQIAPNSISAAMSANSNNKNNSNEISSTSQDNTINNNSVVVTNTSTIKSAQHTPLLSAQQGGQEQQEQQEQQDQLSLQAKQTPNTTFSPEQPKSFATVLTPSQHEKIEKWQARNDATTSNTSTTTGGNTFQNTYLTPSTAASSSNINYSTTITSNQYNGFDNNLYNNKINNQKNNNGNNNKSVGEYNDEDDEDEDNDDIMTSITANNNNNNNLYSSASTINGGNNNSNNNKLLPPLTIHGNRRWKKLTKAQQRREQAQKNAFEAFASALLHSVSPFMAPLRAQCKTSLPHIKLDQRFGKIGQPQTAIAQFIVAPLVTNYRPRHFHDVTPGDLMEYHYDMALVMAQLNSAYGLVIGYGSTWKRYAVPYCYVLCSEYRQEVLRLCPHEIPNSRQEAIYTDDILKDITDVILAVEELEPLQHMSLLQAMRKRVNLTPMYDAFDAIFKPIENYRIEIYDLHKTPTRFLLKTSKPEIEQKPHPIVLYGDDKLWEELPLVTHVNPNDDVAHLPSRITHLHIGYTKPSDTSTSSTTTTTEEGHQTPIESQKMKQPVKTTTAAIAGNNVATLLAHAEAKQANRSTTSKENTRTSNKSVNAHTTTSSSSSSSLVKSTGTNVDIKGRVANLAEHLVGKHHTVLQEKAQSVKANNKLGTNTTNSTVNAAAVSSKSKVDALVTEGKKTIKEVVRNAKNVVSSVKDKLWHSTSNSSSSSSSPSAALPLPSSTVMLPFAISVLCVSLTAGALLWKRRENR